MRKLCFFFLTEYLSATSENVKFFLVLAFVVFSTFCVCMCVCLCFSLFDEKSLNNHYSTNSHRCSFLGRGYKSNHVMSWKSNNENMAFSALSFSFFSSIGFLCVCVASKNYKKKKMSHFLSTEGLISRIRRALLIL